MGYSFSQSTDLAVELFRMRDDVVVMFKRSAANFAVKVFLVRVDQVVRFQVRHARLVTTAKFAFEARHPIWPDMFVFRLPRRGRRAPFVACSVGIVARVIG